MEGYGSGGQTSETAEPSEPLDVSMLHPIGTLALVTRLTQTPRGVQLLLLGQKRVKVDVCTRLIRRLRSYCVAHP